MPTIMRIDGYRFYFFSHEPNEPPHVHVDAGASTLKAWLSPVELASSHGFRAHEINAILRLVAQHQTVLLEAWYEYFSSDR